MPVWSPGDYHVQNFVKNVADLTAEGSGTAQKIDANTWEIGTDGKEMVSLSYSLPNTPPGFFSENVRVESTWAFVNGPAAYMYVVGHKQDPVALNVQTPEGWEIATPLEPTPPT